MIKKELLIYLLIFALLLQLGCSSITQITYPVDESKNDSDIRSLNYFGEKLSSTITLTNSFEVKVHWMKLKDDKIYFLTRGLDDTTSVAIDKIKSVRFYDFYGGCMKGAGLSLGLIILEGIILWGFSSNDTGHPGAGMALLVIFPATILLSTLFGISFMGEREFNFTRISE